MNSTSAVAQNKCPYCGKLHDARCPDVKAIEYNADGTVKRVEFFSHNDYAPRIGPDPFALPPVQPAPSWPPFWGGVSNTGGSIAAKSDAIPFNA